MANIEDSIYHIEYLDGSHIRLTKKDNPELVKNQTPPAPSTKLLDQPAGKPSKEALLEAIAIRTPFTYEAVAAFYEHYKSYDLLLMACDYAAKNGLTILLLPPAEYI